MARYLVRLHSASRQARAASLCSVGAAGATHATIDAFKSNLTSVSHQRRHDLPSTTNEYIKSAQNLNELTLHATSLLQPSQPASTHCFGVSYPSISPAAWLFATQSPQCAGAMPLPPRLFPGDEELGKKDDDHKPGMKNSMAWKPRIAMPHVQIQKRTVKRVFWGVVVLVAVYFFVKNIPTVSNC